MSTENAHNHTVPQTKGRTISWASFYDTLVWIVSLGKSQDMRLTTAELAQIRPGDTVLDVGCGTGDLTLIAKKRAGSTGKVIGIDAAPEMIEVAQKKAAQAGVEAEFQVDLVERMSFPEEAFDVVLSSLVMHHLPEALKREGMAEMYRVLKPGGRLFIVDIESSAGGSFWQRLSDLMVNLHGGHSAMQGNVQKLVPLVEAAGFKAIETGKIGRQFAFVKGEKP